MNSFYFRKWFLLFELVALVTLLDELQMHSPLQIHYSENAWASSLALCERIHNRWINTENDSMSGHHIQNICTLRAYICSPSFE